MTLPHDVAGTGRPLVLLHAGVADRGMWSEHLQPLADAGLLVVAVDLPGFGEAPAASTEDAPWNDVLDTMDALGIDRVALVGNSFGGLVAQRIAALAPERIASLMLISSPASGIEPTPELAAVWAAEEAALERGDIDAAVLAVVNAWTLPGAPRELRERLAAMQRRAFELQLDRGEVPEGPDPLENDLRALARVDAPALVAVGEHDKPDFHSAADALTRALRTPAGPSCPAPGILRRWSSRGPSASCCCRSSAERALTGQWRGQDSNLRRQSQRVYSASPLTAREPRRGRPTVYPGDLAGRLRASASCSGPQILRKPRATAGLRAASAASSACGSRFAERARG
jgi:pimeloyl-ACP methyl ester carboxylesterase